eukprot:m.22861 g.22861  ORF g.22861 m.22861 type:complete len:487 (+) comp4035_c0_seq1:39-1499(+)
MNILPLVLVVGEVLAQTAPEQVHLAFGGPPDANGHETISVSWYTASQVSDPQVCWTPGAHQPSVACTPTTSSTATTRQYLDNHGYHHHAYLTGLSPASPYTYAVGSQESPPNGTNAVTFSFIVPDSRPNRGPFSVSLFGDMGWLGSKQRPDLVPFGGLQKNWSAVGTRETVERLKDAQAIDFVWHLGDIAYADDAFDVDPLKFEYENVYNGFVGWFQNVSSIMPYMVSVGNHESECHSPACVVGGTAKQLSNFSAYNARFRMPSASSKGVLNMWYSYDFGPVHFISVNSETDFPGAGEENTGDSGDKLLPAGHFAPDGAYLAWLEADLAAASANRATRPWIIAGGHRPFREIAGNGVQELFAKYQVDLYFCGHTHSYVRSFPTYNNVFTPQADPNHYVNPNGTTEIVVGGAGCDEMPDALSTPAANRNEQHITGRQSAPPPADGVVVATAKEASGVLTVVNATAIHWQLLYSHSTGDVLDDFWITK